MADHILTRRCKARSALPWLIAVILALGSGIAYRLLASYLQVVTESPIMLPVPLQTFPRTIVGWQGEDVPLTPNVQRVAGNDDFLSRTYQNEPDNQRVYLYMAYSARPRTMLGHKPDVCMVAAGWVRDHTEPGQIISRSGKHIPCLIHSFHRPSPQDEEMIVLNFYILNGKVITDDAGFSGIGWRTPNIAGDPARYVAQVQISSTLESSVQDAATEMADLILTYFPTSDKATQVPKNTTDR